MANKLQRGLVEEMTSIMPCPTSYDFFVISNLLFFLVDSPLAL